MTACTRLLRAVAILLFFSTASPLSAKSTDDALVERYLAQFSGAERAIAQEGVRLYSNPAVAIASAEFVLERLKQRTPGDFELQRAATLQLLDAYLANGFSRDAVDIVESLDAAARERIFGGRRIETSPDSAMVLYLAPQTVAGELVAAYADLGKREDAAPFVDYAARPPTGTLPKAPLKAAPLRIIGACVRDLLRADASADWFEWRFKPRPRHEGPGFEGCSYASRARSYVRLAAGGMEAANFPAAWRVSIKPVFTRPGGSYEYAAVAASLAQLPALQQRVDDLREQRKQFDRRDARWFEGDPVPQSEVRHAGEHGAESKALARSIEARLAEPRFDPYRVVAAKAEPPAKREPRPPGECKAARCVQDKHYRWELSLSDDYDPTAGLAADGWWLRRVGRADRSDVRWYLGIRQHRPYELRPSSVPFVVDGELRLPVRRAEIRGETGFPPAALDVARDGVPELIVARLDDIARDSDGDGLTDLAEQQLLLDPRSADTDGDGLADGADPLPNVAYRPSPALADPLVAALRWLLAAPDLALAIDAWDSGAFARRRGSEERTLYLVADPARLAGISASRRIVVLPPSLDLDMLRKHPAWSVFYPMQVSLDMIGTDRAEVVYSFGWRGGKLALERRDGVWRIGALEDWIT